MAILENKIAVITGAKGGLGSAVTKAFLSEGARVVGISRSIRPDDFPYPSFTALAAELSTAEGARRAIETAVASHGRFDALVHVMGGFAGGQSVADTSDELMEQMLDMNFRAAFYVLRAAIPPMRAGGGGRILAVASRQGVEPAAMVGAYSASKAALVSLVKTVALENKDAGITANSVLPGAMDTPGASGKALVKTADVAALLVYLASGAAESITGAAIPVYGRQA